MDMVPAHHLRSSDGMETVARVREDSFIGPTRAFSITDVMSVDESDRLRDRERLSVFFWDAGGKRKRVNEVSMAAAGLFHVVLKQENKGP